VVLAACEPSGSLTALRLLLRAALAQVRLLDAILSTITEALVAGDSVALVGFGTVKVGALAARTGKKPATGEALDIAASTVAKFTAGKALKDAVNK